MPIFRGGLTLSVELVLRVRMMRKSAVADWMRSRTMEAVRVAEGRMMEVGSGKRSVMRLGDQGWVLANGIRL